MRSLFALASFAVLLGSLGLTAGCGEKTAADKSAADQPAATPASSDAEAAALAKLSAEDLKLVKLQDGKCPVSGEKLGSMGEPFKIVVKGRTVLLCCEGCKDDLLANPDKYLAKLPAAQAKK